MVTVALNQLECGRDDDNGSEAEPYLWTVFFKVDGSTVDVVLTPDHETGSLLVGLDGEAEYHFSRGSHGNLGDGIASGESLAIPPAVGTWETQVDPIVVDVLFGQVELPGTVGVVPILLEEDNVSDDGAEAGHRKLNDLVEQKLNELIGSFEAAIPRDDVENAETIVMEAVESHFEAGVRDIKDEIEEEVEDAIAAEQGVFENLWSLANKDDTIGTHVWRTTDAEVIESDGTVPLRHTWDNKYGEWTISGSITADVPDEPTDDAEEGTGDAEGATDDDGTPVIVPDLDLDLGEYRLPDGYNFGLSEHLAHVADALDGATLVPESFLTDTDAVLDIREISGRRFAGEVQLDLAVALYPEDASRLDLSTVKVLQSAPESARFRYGGGSRASATASHYAVLTADGDAVLDSADEEATVVVEPRTDAGTVRLVLADSAADLWRYVEVEISESLGESPQALDWHRVVD